jgi:hypothetical protein
LGWFYSIWRYISHTIGLILSFSFFFNVFLVWYMFLHNIGWCCFGFWWFFLQFVRYHLVIQS